MSEIARSVGLYWTSTALHVSALRQAGLVETLRAGRRRILFPADKDPAEHPPLDPRAAAVLSEPACRRVAEAIRTHPERRVWELCDLLDMSERATYHHVKRLVDAGLVQTSRPGMYRGLRATPALVAFLRGPYGRPDPALRPPGDQPRS